MSNRFDLYIRAGQKTLRQLENYMEVARKVKEIVKSTWPDANVYVFGSVVEGRYTAASDIDILILVDRYDKDEAYRVKALIYEAIDAPVEVHLATDREFETWYSRFIDRLIEV